MAAFRLPPYNAHNLTIHYNTSQLYNFFHLEYL